MDELINNVQSIFDDADAQIAAVMADRDLTIDARQRRADALRQQANQAAAEQAALIVNAAAQVEQEAARQLSAQLAAQADATDWQRQMVSNDAAKAAAAYARDWNEVTALAQTAHDTGDVATLRALQTLALPQLRQRVESRDDAFYGRVDDLVALERNLSAAISALEPAPLREARARHHAAAKTAAELAAKLDMLNFKRAYAAGVAGPLAGALGKTDFFSGGGVRVVDNSDVAGPRSGSRQRWP